VLNLLSQTIADNSFVFTENDDVSKKRGSQEMTASSDENVKNSVRQK
jgi:hypothetical protein